MNIDVLLTDGQQSQAIQQGAKGWFAALNTPAGNEFLESIADSLCKVQCLKLLEWLKEELVLTRPHLLDEMINIQSYELGQAHQLSFDIAKINKLESKLKDNHD